MQYIAMPLPQDPIGLFEQSIQGLSAYQDSKPTQTLRLDINSGLHVTFNIFSLNNVSKVPGTFPIPVRMPGLPVSKDVPAVNKAENTPNVPMENERPLSKKMSYNLLRLLRVKLSENSLRKAFTQRNIATTVDSDHLAALDETPHAMSENLVLVEATEAQKQHMLENEILIPGDVVPRDVNTRIWNDVMNSLPYERERYDYVLVARNDPDPLNIYCYVRLYSRKLFISLDGSSVVERPAIYASALTVPKKWRHYGYAMRCQKSMAAEVLSWPDADPSYETVGTEDWHKPYPTKVHPVGVCTYSTRIDELLSRVAQIVPIGHFQLKLSSQELFRVPLENDPGNPRCITEADVIDIARTEGPLLKAELQALVGQPNRPANTTHVCYPPMGPEIQARIRISKLITEYKCGKSPDTWGVEYGDRGSSSWFYTIYTIKWCAKGIEMLYVRAATPAQFTLLLSHAAEVARAYGVDNIHVRSLDPKLVEGTPYKIYRGNDIPEEIAEPNTILGLFGPRSHPRPKIAEQNITMTAGMDFLNTTRH